MIVSRGRDRLVSSDRSLDQAGRWSSALKAARWSRVVAAAVTMLLALPMATTAAQTRAKGKAAPPPELPPVEALAEPPEPPAVRLEPLKRLRLMLLDMADLREPESREGFEAPKTTFRHTFGSQRQTSDETLPLLINAEALGADVVVLRGITNPRLARRMFPARDWRFMHGKSAPPATEPRVRTLAPLAVPEPTAAVAMWLQQGVRFAGTEPAGSPATPNSVLGASLRMLTGLGPMWVLSPSAPCREPCRPVEDWLAAKVAGGALALVGGIMPAVSLSPPPSSGATPALPPALSKPAPKGAVPLVARQTNGIITLTGLDAGGRCGGDGKAGPTLHLRHPPSRTPLKVAGYLLALERPAPSQTPAPQAQSTGAKAGLAPARAQACVLLLDIEAS